MQGALAGRRIIEIASIGPGPFCGMLLADHGADVIRVERPGGVHAGPATDPSKDPLLRSRRSLVVDLKSSAGVEVVRRLCHTADGLVEGFRPGVMERLGLGPNELIGDNPRLVFGRMTGWGQSGPLAATAGHDINYIALSGALHALGRAGEKPTPPINLLGDFGGGGLLLAFGMVSAMLSAERTGRGQVVDCSMVEGSALLMSMIWGLKAMGMWRDERGVNLLDTGAHFYDTYECRDGRFVSVGAIEPQFYRELLARLGLSSDPRCLQQDDPLGWPALKARLAAVFLTRTRDEWCELFEGSDACVAPVLSMAEAPAHPHNRARGVFTASNGVVQPAPAPRFSATPAADPRPPAQAEADAGELLAEAGFSAAEIESLSAAGVFGSRRVVEPAGDGRSA